MSEKKKKKKKFGKRPKVNEARVEIYFEKVFKVEVRAFMKKKGIKNLSRFVRFALRRVMTNDNEIKNYFVE